MIAIYNTWGTDKDWSFRHIIVSNITSVTPYVRNPIDSFVTVSQLWINFSPTHHTSTVEEQIHRISNQNVNFVPTILHSSIHLSGETGTEVKRIVSDSSLQYFFIVGGNRDFAVYTDIFYLVSKYWNSYCHNRGDLSNLLRFRTHKSKLLPI